MREYTKLTNYKEEDFLEVKILKCLAYSKRNNQ